MFNVVSGAASNIHRRKICADFFPQRADPSKLLL
jgi:hypothetical protein